MNPYTYKLQKISKGDPIKYKDEYYLINEIKYSSGLPAMPELIELAYINTKKEKDNKPDPQWVNPNDIDIHIIHTKLHEQLIKYLRWLDRYNMTINHLNKKCNSKLLFLNNKNVEADIELLFGRCKLKMNQLNKIERTLKKTQSQSIQLKEIMKNPFNFITSEFQLISFLRADTICDEFKLNIPFEEKCKAWAYDLFLGRNNSYYLLKWKFISEFNKFCASKLKDNKVYLPHIEKVTVDKTINKNIYKTIKYLFQKEKQITDLCMDLYYDKKIDVSLEEVNREITTYEKMKGLAFHQGFHQDFHFEDEQKKGIINSLTNKFSIITGPPGTGKTEIIKCIITILNNLHKKRYPDDKVKQPTNVAKSSTIAMLAPTGLAYINMRCKQDPDYYNEQISGTCHRVLYHTFENIKTHEDDCNCKIHEDDCKYKIHEQYCKCKDECKWDLHIKVIILDEASMIDIPMFHELLKLCEYFDSQLIILGDIKQLPSIGPGTVLKSLIQSNCFDVTVLKTIKRQEAGALLNNIIKMNEDIILNQTAFNDSTMELIDINSFIQHNKRIKKEEIIRLIDKYALVKETTKFIAYYKDDKFIFNINLLNNILQNIFNPNKVNIPSNNRYDDKYTFCVDDRIIRTENDYSGETMRANGEDAKIIRFNNNKVYIINGEDEIEEEISINNLYENFALNYAVNIHKSQGSQYSTVVLFIEPDSNYIDKTALYTAISRSKERCLVVSDINTFQMCQKNTKNDENKVSLFMRESDTYEL